jgi:ATP/maltotriose-dependent transcriptional regulator MalT
VLALDNYQEVSEDAAFHLVMAEAMEQIPDGLNVFVLSRIEPPAGYASLLAADAIALLDGEQLRLTFQETKAIARKRGVQDDRSLEALYERSHGWAAGLTLLLVRVREQASLDGHEEAESLQHVFGYFAQRVFDGAPPENQQALMQLSFLPLITVALAEQLTGMGEAGRLLDYLYKRHLFTDRRRVTAQQLSAAGQASYSFQFHALFRTFLQHRARTTYSIDMCREIVFRAARLLDASGYWEEALGLYADAGDWTA